MLSVCEPDIGQHDLHAAAGTGWRMKFVVDECTGPAVAAWLQAQQHDVISIYDTARGLEDEKILEFAYREQRVLITNDKDFGELIFRNQLAHHGVVLLRLVNATPDRQIALLDGLFKQNVPLIDNFTVVTESGYRTATHP